MAITKHKISGLNKCLIEAIQFILALHRQFWLAAVISRFSSQILNKMEILIFENTPFREIPEQDNPYYDKDDTTECLIITRVPDYIPTFEVSHISSEKSLTVLGVFFHDIKHAQTFANAVSQNGL